MTDLVGFRKVAHFGSGVGGRIDALPSADAESAGVPVRVSGRPPSGDRCRGALDRLRLITWTAAGTGLLLAAQRLQPEARSLFAGPSGAVEWLSVICGLAGLWLVPGLWLSAVMVRTGAGLPAWLGTRIATTLIWYAMVGPVIHHLGQGAQVTTRGLLLATAAATAAVCLGLALGLSPWPVGLWSRVVIAAVVGAVCAQGVLAMSMRVWTEDMNYSHIRRLDWLIVLVTAGLVVAGALVRVGLPSLLRAGNLRVAVLFLAVFAMTVAALQVVDSRWSTQQLMPSAFGIEQTRAPVDADIAFVLAAIGPDGPGLIADAEFLASDADGSPLPLRTRMIGADAASGQAMLLGVLPASDRAALCEPGRAAKVTVHERNSGAHVQAVIPAEWCDR